MAGAELSQGPACMPAGEAGSGEESQPQPLFITASSGCVKEDSYYFCIQNYLKCREFSTETASTFDPKHPEKNNTTFSP